MFSAAPFTTAKTWKPSVSIDKWTEKEDVAHVYNGILLSHKKGWDGATWMDLDMIKLVKEV